MNQQVMMNRLDRALEIAEEVRARKQKKKKEKEQKEKEKQKQSKN